jgi:hypothetical protein
MTLSQRHTMLVALLIATALVILNIIAVTTGNADAYYASAKEWIETYLLLPSHDH